MKFFTGVLNVCICISVLITASALFVLLRSQQAPTPGLVITEEVSTPRRGYMATPGHAETLVEILEDLPHGSGPFDSPRLKVLIVGSDTVCYPFRKSVRMTPTPTETIKGEEEPQLEWNLDHLTVTSDVTVQEGTKVNGLYPPSADTLSLLPYCCEPPYPKDWNYCAYCGQHLNETRREREWQRLEAAEKGEK